MEYRRLWFSAVMLGLLAGCATNPTVTSRQLIFYPPPPAAPRIQFLVGFSVEQDLGSAKVTFAELITEEKRVSDAIDKPYGIVMRDSQVLVCDTATHAINIMDLSGQPRMQRFAPTGLAEMRTPIGIAVDTDGTRYVADSGRQRILIYGPDEVLRAEIASDKDVMKPTGIAVKGNRLYVADLEGSCVHVYDKDGYKPLFTIPRNPKAEQPGKLFKPVNIALDNKGQLYVCDIASCEVQVYDTEGKHLRTIGSRGDSIGQFVRPKGIAVDSAGRVFVVDAATQVCQIFDANGKLLLFFGEPNNTAGSLALPAGICVGEQNVAFFQKFAAPDFVVEELILITNQYGAKKVNVYGLGHKK
jgi:sugar lactone lactonase YvrE